jgi:hypothetical protein
MAILSSSKPNYTPVKRKSAFLITFYWIVDSDSDTNRHVSLWKTGSPCGIGDELSGRKIRHQCRRRAIGGGGPGT